MTTKNLAQTGMSDEILGNEQAYLCDLYATAPRVSDEDQQLLLTAARKGDEQAKETLLLGLSRRIRGMAVRYYQYVRNADPESYRIEYLDLVQAGNETLWAKWEQALTKDDPLAYLVGCAKWGMRCYAREYARAITTPEHCSCLDTLSMDVPLDDDADTCIRDILVKEDPVLPTYTDDQLAALHNALSCFVTQQQREWIARLYGLYEHAPETMSEIAQADKVYTSRVCYQRDSALKRLREVLVTPTALCDVYTRDEVCQILGTTANGLRNIVFRYKIKSYARGLYPKQQIDVLTQVYRHYSKTPSSTKKVAVVC